MNFLITYPSIACIFFLILGMAARWFAVSSDRKRTEWMLATSCLVIPIGVVAGSVVVYISRWRPLKYDQFVYKLDALVGQPSFVLGRLAAHSHGLRVLLNVSYDLLPTITLLTFAATLWLRSEEEALVLLRTFVPNLILSPLIYLLFPVCGPAYAFPGFPFVQPDLAPHMIPINAPPNGVPSVHMSSALLIMWFLRHWKWGWLAGLTFAILTIMATLGTGQHYLFDLICAVPYTVLVYRLAAYKNPARMVNLVDRWPPGEVG